MSIIKHSWHASPPPLPDVYTTRRNESKYLTLRYWDGVTWFAIEYSGTRGGTPFKWPRPSRTKRPGWAALYKDRVRLRKISSYLGEIQWGEPCKVFDEKEVLKHLVATGRLPADWRTAFQVEMRGLK